MSISALIATHPIRRDSLLPILHDVQNELGYIPADAVPLIAEALNLSRADVHGVVSFYHEFRQSPAERPVIKVCRAEACQARGVDSVAQVFDNDPRVKVEAVYCLGLCASGPSAIVGDQVYGRLDPEKARQLVSEVSS